MRKLPCDIMVENPDVIENKVVCPKIDVKYIDIKIYEDENGDRKILSVEAPVHAVVSQEVPSTASVVLDAYSTVNKLNLDYVDLELPVETKIY